jgi:hypothetical protein
MLFASSWYGYVTGGRRTGVALTNAQKQARWRARRDALARSHPDVVERDLLAVAERCGGLSMEERHQLADRLAAAARAWLRRSQALAALAKRVRAGGG